MDIQKLRVGSIDASNNYRRRFKNIQELMDDIVTNGGQEKGLLQPIVVRILDDGSHKLVAGGRRHLAWTNLYGEDAFINCSVRRMSEAEAIAAMKSENEQRQDTNAVEDSELAAKMLALVNGNKEEAANRLGWKPELLNRRLAIMNAIDAVRDAYIDEKIFLGHVEILATLRREMQVSVLAKLLAAPQVPSVDQLKAMAEQVLLGLEAAIFDKKECGGCQYNTGNQQALFETSFDGSRCTNSECYQVKTEAELETRRMALTDTFQVVRIVRPGDNLTLTKLRADGPKGVGEEQAKACRTCKDFGACISATPDKMGAAFKDICFNATCNAEKVSAQMAASKAAETQNALSNGAANAGLETGANQNSAPKTDRKKPQENESSKPKAPSSEPRNAVREYREAIWRLVLNRAALKLPVEKSRALLLAMCLYRPSTLDSHVAIKAVGKATNKESLSNTDAFKLTKELLTFGTQELGAALLQIPAFVSTQLEINAIVSFLKALDVRIENFWKLNETFADLLTKTELDAVCTEIGLDMAMGKEYAKAKGGSKADFVKAVLAVEGFEYVGKIPALMRW